MHAKCKVQHIILHTFRRALMPKSKADSEGLKDFYFIHKYTQGK